MNTEVARSSPGDWRWVEASFPSESRSSKGPARGKGCKGKRAESRSAGPGEAPGGSPGELRSSAALSGLRRGLGGRRLVPSPTVPKARPLGGLVQGYPFHFKDWRDDFWEL